MTATTDTPRIYVACLASYNAGTLHGAWIDATDADAIREEVAAMLKASPVPGAEEWAIHDTDGFHGINVGEYDDLERVAEIADALEQHGPAVAAFVNNGYPVEDFAAAFQGIHDSEEDFAVDLARDTGMMDGWPETAELYFNWEAFARDLFLGGDYWRDDATGAVFAGAY